MSTKQDLLGLIQNLRAMLDRKEKESVEAHKEINWAHDYHWRKLSRMDGLVKAMQLTEAQAESRKWLAIASGYEEASEIWQRDYRKAQTTIAAMRDALEQVKLNLEDPEQQVPGTTATFITIPTTRAIYAALASGAGKAHADRMQKLEMALRFYGDQHNWPLYLEIDRPRMPVEQDRGAIARRALEEKNDD